MHLRIRHRRLGDHHHAKVYVGPDAGHLALAGTLALRAAPVDELEIVCSAFEAGAEAMREPGATGLADDDLAFDEVDEDQPHPDVADEPLPSRPFAVRRNRIAHYRGLLGLKQRDLAERIGIGQPDLSLIEAGFAVPRDDVLELLASQLATPPEMLYPDDDDARDR